MYWPPVSLDLNDGLVLYGLYLIMSNRASDLAGLPLQVAGNWSNGVCGLNA